MAKELYSPLYELVDQLCRKRLLRFIVAGHLLKNFGFPTPTRDVSTCGKKP
jgi:hypothetical protein